MNLLMSLAAVSLLLASGVLLVAANSVTTESPEPPGNLSRQTWTYFPPNPLVTLAEFNAAAALKGGNPDISWYNGFIASLPKALINTRTEAAMFLTHADWESVGFKYTREVYCQTNMAACQAAYPANAGGLQTVVYYGRGPLQLTWDYNYIAASQYLYQNNTLRDNPDLVASDPAVGWATAAYYWYANVHSVANPLTFGNTTKAINGPLECDGGPNSSNMQLRFDLYQQIRQIMKMVAAPANDGYCHT